MDNVATHLQRLALGPQARRRARPGGRDDPHARVRRLVAPRFRSGDDATFLRQNRASGCATPVFQVAFANRQQRLLAAVDEDGVVSLVDTAKSSEAPRNGVFQSVHREWQAHENAIFDLAWARDDAFLLTAAGDLRATAWDVETNSALFTLLGGHSMSVKCVRQSADHGDIIATGARDGNVLVWDARTPSKPVAQLVGVHSAPSPSPSPPSSQSRNNMFVSPSGTRKRRKITAAPTVSSSPRSVTSVEFLAGGNEIATAGAVDGVVKFWDLRRLTAQRKIQLSSTMNTASVPVRSISCSSRVGAQRGITSLALDRSRSRLLVSVLNDELCVVDVHAREPEPLLRLDGHVASSFYVKSAFSPDGDFVVSGSGDGAVYLWDARPTTATVRSPTLALKGHSGEVNGVAWHASDFTALATCSDDGTVRVWQAAMGVEASSFSLKRRSRQWQNWGDFEQQDGGRAYRVEASDVAVDEPAVETPPESLLSPPVIRRNRDALTTPARRRSTPQTLLDFWGR